MARTDARLTDDAPQSETMDGRPMKHAHPPGQERRIREAALDRTLESTFPASDPPSTNPNPDDDSLIESPPVAGC
jgi:hypothetical protein